MWPGALVELDDIDRMIVKELVADGRLSIPALADRVGVSRATAYNRFDRLVDNDVITGFKARIDPAAVDLAVAALVLISAHQGHWSDLNDHLLSTAGVQWVGMGAGSFDFIVLVRAADLQQLRDVVLQELLNSPGVRNTQTAVLLDESRPDDAIL